MEPNDLKEYTEELAAQSNELMETLVDITLHSNGGVSLESLLLMPTKKVSMISKGITDKLKRESKTKGIDYL